MGAMHWDYENYSSGSCSFFCIAFNILFWVVLNIWLINYFVVVWIKDFLMRVRKTEGWKNVGSVESYFLTVIGVAFIALVFAVDIAYLSKFILGYKKVGKYFFYIWGLLGGILLMVRMY